MLNKIADKISTEKNRYEGSLWRYESSFGNLLRDHRARFRGDLLSINEMGLIVNVPPPKIDPEGQPGNAPGCSLASSSDHLVTHGARSHSKRDIASLVSNDCHIVLPVPSPRSF